MSLTLDEITAWLVQRGYGKLDGTPTKQGGILYPGSIRRHWSISDFGNGNRFLSIHLDGEPVPDAPGSHYSDMSLSLRIGEGDRIASAELQQSYSGSALAGSRRAPETVGEIEQLLEQGKAIFAEFCQAMERSEQSRSNEELRQDIGNFLAQNPSALDLWCGAEPIDEEEA